MIPPNKDNLGVEDLSKVQHQTEAFTSEGHLGKTSDKFPEGPHSTLMIFNGDTPTV